MLTIKAGRIGQPVREKTGRTLLGNVRQIAAAEPTARSEIAPSMTGETAPRDKQVFSLFGTRLWCFFVCLCRRKGSRLRHLLRGDSSQSAIVSACSFDKPNIGIRRGQGCRSVLRYQPVNQPSPRKIAVQSIQSRASGSRHVLAMTPPRRRARASKRPRSKSSAIGLSRRMKQCPRRNRLPSEVRAGPQKHRIADLLRLRRNDNSKG